MKIGLISIHSAHNYGSVLQAYALQEILKKYSNNFELINYRPNYLDCQYNMFSIRVYKRFPGFINKIMHFGWRIIMFPGRLTKYKKFENFINNNMVLTHKYKKINQLRFQKLDYDIVFVGSDQVWNTDITEGFDKVFYLDFLNENVIRASYAASIGRNSLDKKYFLDYKNCLEKFDYISLREQSSVHLIAEFTKKDISVTLDPTLLLKKSKWELLIKNSLIKCESADYIFVYILEDNPEFTKIVNNISKLLGLKVLSISKKKRFNNEKIFPNAGPEDFLKLCYYSKFIISNSFHGTVFSIIFEKNNCIVPHLNTGGRMIDLMNICGLNERIIRTENDLNNIDLKKDVNYELVKEKLKVHKEYSKAYLEKVINEK